jgi:hypothetical protein
MLLSHHNIVGTAKEVLLERAPARRVRRVDSQAVGGKLLLIPAYASADGFSSVARDATAVAGRGRRGNQLAERNVSPRRPRMRSFPNPSASGGMPEDSVGYVPLRKLFHDFAMQPERSGLLEAQPAELASDEPSESSGLARGVGGSKRGADSAVPIGILQEAAEKQQQAESANETLLTGPSSPILPGVTGKVRGRATDTHAKLNKEC